MSYWGLPNDGIGTPDRAELIRAPTWNLAVWTVCQGLALEFAAIVLVVVASARPVMPLGPQGSVYSRSGACRRSIQ
jgi:hypothetical protein